MNTHLLTHGSCHMVAITNNPERPSLARKLSHGETVQWARGQSQKGHWTGYRQTPLLQAMDGQQQSLAAPLTDICFTSSDSRNVSFQYRGLQPRSGAWLYQHSRIQVFKPGTASLPSCTSATHPHALHPCQSESRHCPGSQRMNLDGHLWAEVKMLAPSPAENAAPDAFSGSHRPTYTQRLTHLKQLIENL